MPVPRGRRPGEVRSGRGPQDLEIVRRAIDPSRKGEAVAVGEVAAVALVAHHHGLGAHHVPGTQAEPREGPVAGTVHRVAAGALGCVLEVGVAALGMAVARGNDFALFGQSDLSIDRARRLGKAIIRFFFGVTPRQRIEPVTELLEEIELKPAAKKTAVTAGLATALAAVVFGLIRSRK